MQNSILLENISRDELKEIMRAVIVEERASAQPKPQQKDGYITRHETGAKCHLCVQSVDKLAKEGILVKYRIGGRVLFLESEVDAAMKQVVMRRRKL